MSCDWIPNQAEGGEIPPFELENPDFDLSPYTGMSRAEWKRCGIHVLEGAFQYVEDFEDPILFPKFPGKSYPKRGNLLASKRQRSWAIFEAMARTFNIAAPLLMEDPELSIHGIQLAEYYKYHFLKLLTDPSCSYFIDEPEVPSQPSCELGGLSLWMLIAPEVFWERLSQTEKDKVANRIKIWAESWTSTHNWRYFNVMMMTFLEHNGYPIDTTLMYAHLDNVLLHYAGDGWYRDAGYDYYTIHLFHLYNMVWAEKYGQEHAPGRVRVIRRHFNEFMETSPMLFSREGKVKMYGRSIISRTAANDLLPAAFMGPVTPKIKPGAARRIASSALLQFVSHPDFFDRGIPSLGFYGPFEPAVQSYSCSASPYWMFISYIALLLPENHPFWTEKEEAGSWEAVPEKETRTEYLPGPGILLSSHGASGTSEIRPGKLLRSNSNYSRLVYNTDFPWEAKPGNGITSAALTIKLEGIGETPELPTTTDAVGYHEDVLYRQSIYGFEGKVSKPFYVDMASIIIPNGEIRIDRIRKIRKCKVYLGHFSLPHIRQTPQVRRLKPDGKDCMVGEIFGRQLALTSYEGWQFVDTLSRSGLHPETQNSTLLFTACEDLKYE